MPRLSGSNPRKHSQNNTTKITLIMTLQYNILKKRQKETVESQTSPPKGIQPQNYVIATEQPPVI